MSRKEKIKRSLILEANRRILNEIADIAIPEPEMDITNTSMGGGEGLSLECVKIDYENPENSKK